MDDTACLRFFLVDRLRRSHFHRQEILRRIAEAALPVEYQIGIEPMTPRNLGSRNAWLGNFFVSTR